MSTMKSQAVDGPATAVVIGDVVSSRAAPDRAGLHARLAQALVSANRTSAPTTPWRITVGDEFQGAFATVGAAVHAVLLLRTALAGAPARDGQQELAPVDLRFGIGWGPVATLADEPRVEDGPGWWAAREAVEEVKRSARRAGLRHRRTSYRRAPGPPPVSGPDPDLVNAALLCQDQVVGSLSSRSLRLLGGLLQGRPQADLAELEGISASAVSQRVRHDGLAVAVAADELLRRVS